MPNSFTPEQIEEFLQEFFDVVGARQYVGARYVPIFGRKDEESITWDNSEPYEPLTIVLYQGNSYTSRQYVPAGVELDDNAYWANTGNYNAQIEQYRQETARVAGQLTDLQDAIGEEESERISQDGVLQGAIEAEKTARIGQDDIRPIVFGTVADMAASGDLKDGFVCMTKGYHEIGDDGGAYYEIDGTGTANGMDVIECQDGLLAHVIPQPSMTPETFGAYGDGTHDDVASINRALEVCKHLVFGAKTYLITTQINVPASGYIIEGASASMQSGATIVRSNNDINMFYFTNANGCQLKNLQIYGNGSDGFGNVGGYGIKLPNNSYYFIADNVTIRNIEYGVHVTSGWNVTLNNVLCYYVNKAFHFSSCTDMFMKHCIAYYANCGVTASAASVSAFDLYTDNCYYGIDATTSNVTVFRYFTEGGRDAMGGVAATSIKSDAASDVIVHTMTLADASGRHVICEIGEAGTRKVKIHDFRTSNSFNFAIGENANYGCLELYGNFTQYTSNIPAKVFANGCYSSRIHGVWIDNKKKHYYGNSQANLISVSGNSYGRVTLYSESAVETVYFNNTTALTKSESTSHLLVTRNSSGAVQIEHSSGLTNYTYQVDLVTDGSCGGSDLA